VAAAAAPEGAGAAPDTVAGRLHALAAMAMESAIRAREDNGERISGMGALRDPGEL